MAKAFEDDLINQGVPLFIVHFGKDMSTQRVESYNLDNVDPRCFKAFAHAIIPGIRDFIEDPKNQDRIEKWKSKYLSKD